MKVKFTAELIDESGNKIPESVKLIKQKKTVA